MKIALFLLVICSVILAVSSLPAPDESTDMNDKGMQPWFFDNMAWQFYMCRMQCRFSCLQQGYMNGACKYGATCQCFGFRGPIARNIGYPMVF